MPDAKVFVTFELLDSYGHGVNVQHVIDALADPTENFEIEFPAFGPAAQGRLTKVEVVKDDA